MSEILTATKVRLSFENLLVPRAQDATKPEEKTFSTAILIPKTDTATLDAIRAAITEAMEDGVVKKWNGKRPAQLRNPLRDGDEKYLKDGVTKDKTYAGMFFINAKGPYGGKNQPILLNKNAQQTSSASDIYSGVWGQVKLTFFPYENSGNRGVGAGIATFLSHGEGEALSSADTVESALAEFGLTAPAGTPAAAAAEFAAPTNTAAAPAAEAAAAAAPAGDPWV